MITNVLNRVALFAINSSMGVITFMPNIMMGDSGTARAECAAGYGISASLTFMASGIAGLLHNQYIPLHVSYGLTGLAVGLQICSFVVPNLKYSR